MSPQLDGYPYWSGFSEDADEKAAQRAAIWNHDLVKNDKSHGVHNPQYAIWLLQTSYSDLSQAFGGDDFATAFPLADDSDVTHRKAFLAPLFKLRGASFFWPSEG